MMKWTVIVVLTISLLILLGAILLVAPNFRNTATAHSTSSGVPLAVLGDSDSHAYQDTILIPVTSGKRGGEYRATTLQWTEVLDRLRGKHINQGEWGIWGTGVKIAETLDWLGMAGRAPKKFDFRYNFAVSGAECSDLMTGYYRQAPRLLAEMNRVPDQWKNGVVVIQIGVNTFGQNDSLDHYTKLGVTPQIRSEIMACVDAHRQAISLITASHPQTRFILAGIFDNSNLASNADRWKTPAELASITGALDVFDTGLRALCAEFRNATFVDARSWFRDHWGGRDEGGKPAYKTVNLGGVASVANTRGDDPRNAILTDDHGGVVYNALWARRNIEAMNTAFSLGLPPITFAEIASLVDPSGSIGLR
jgi:GDSL-like Lipase/Acylhydrolase family